MAGSGGIEGMNLTSTVDQIAALLGCVVCLKLCSRFFASAKPF